MTPSGRRPPAGGDGHDPHPAHPRHTGLMRWLLLFAGGVALLLGLIGLMLPVIAEHELVIQMDRSDSAIKAAYVTIKHISQQHGNVPLSVVVTGANHDQGQQYFMRLNQVCKQFLGVALNFLGAIPAEETKPVAAAGRIQPGNVKPDQTALAFKSVAHHLEKQRITTPSMAVA